jgi:hypothetical protein
MGLFLSMAGIIGKSEGQVMASLIKYAKSTGGGLEKANLTFDDDDFCVIAETNNNTSVYYPNWLMDWDEASQFLSEDLNAPVFSFHIHDGDLWMYILFVNGEIADQFNPLPDYWDGNISEEEMNRWKGNADIVTKHVRHVKKQDIENYLVNWDLEGKPGKAYPHDEYENEDYQLIDFMRKLGLPYPITGDLEPAGQVYKFWSKEVKDESKSTPITGESNKPWWKFW